MDFTCKTASFDQYKSDCAVVFTFANTLSASAKLADVACNGAIGQAAKQGDIKDEAGSALYFYPSSSKTQRVLVVSLGKGETKASTLSSDAKRQIAAGLAKSLNQSSVKTAALHCDDLPAEDVELENITHSICQAIIVGHYRYCTTKKSAATKASTLGKVILSHSDKAHLPALKAGAKTGNAAGLGINTARELGNLPGNICTPTYLAQHAKELAKGQAKLTTKVLDEAEMKKLGMHSLLSVSAGSDEPAKLIVMEYKGKASKAPHVLVGKGITFDTGGISLKPGAGMDEMKFDMCGAASVFGVMEALVILQAPVHVIGVVAAAENMPNGKATKPGDVVTSMAGKTIEVLNTDAEGRLVLCDALTYVERFKPKSVVDIATLTGACIVALGKHATGLYANDQALADQLIAAGTQTHDRVWQMPLWDDYKKQLKSNFADLANIGGREAGSVTAACFLSYFTENYPWAHLDIAGPAWHSGSQKGATGRPVSLLLDYLLNAG